MTERSYPDKWQLEADEFGAQECKFSIVIPTYNRPDSLSLCLQEIFCLDTPHNEFEVVVVNDGSNEDYGSVRERFPQVHWVEQTNQGPAAARDLGAKHARGLYLAFTDDDCLVCPDWLNQLELAFIKHGVAAAGGSTVAPPGSGIYDRVSELITKLVYRHYNQDRDRGKFLASANIGVNRELFYELGGFADPLAQRASEDRIFCSKVLSRSLPLVWQEDAVVYHRSGLSFWKFCRLYFSYGRGAANYQKSRASGDARDEAGFYGALPGHLLAELKQDPTLPVLPTLLLLVLWQVCNVAGFAWQMLKGGTY